MRIGFELEKDSLNDGVHFAPKPIFQGVKRGMGYISRCSVLEAIRVMNMARWLQKLASHFGY